MDSPDSSDSICCKRVHKEQVKDLHSCCYSQTHRGIHRGKEKETICEPSE